MERNLKELVEKIENRQWNTVEKEFTDMNSHKLKKVSSGNIVVNSSNGADFLVEVIKYLVNTYTITFEELLGKREFNRLTKKSSAKFDAPKNLTIGSKNYIIETKTNTASKINTIVKAFKTLKEMKGVDISDFSFELEPTNNRNQGGMLTMSRGDIKSEIIDLVKVGACRQIIFTGAPGTGKTYIAKEIAEELGEKLPWSNNKKQYEFVQFHPSYDYTDFVEGLRPIEKGTNITFTKVDGIFKKFCRNVVDNRINEELYFFIIDEINRANLSKVFGELMYGLEKDKRGNKNTINTQYQNLRTFDIDKNDYLKDDVFKDGFFIPENIVIIGTMNDIDRSVDSMDFALRRRFEWKEFIVDEDMLKYAFRAVDEQNNPIYGKVISDNAEELAKHICNLNAIWANNSNEYGLNRQYDISQGLFANLPVNITDFKEIINYTWKYRIRTLLYEYLRGEDNVEQFVDNQCYSAFTGGISNHD